MNDVNDKGNKPFVTMEIQQSLEAMMESINAKAEAKEVSREEAWELNMQALKRFSDARDWAGCLKSLTFLSTRDWHPHADKALAQRIWVALKADVPVSDVVNGLLRMLARFGPNHEKAPIIAALANLMAVRRTPDHPDNEWAQVQAQQMMQQVWGEAEKPDGLTFNQWFDRNSLGEPDEFIPVFMEMLQQMVEFQGDWWLDREALQADLMASQVPEPSAVN